MVQVEQLMQQVRNQEAQYQALTGNSSFGNIMNDASLRNYLPEQWQNIYDQARNGGLSGISSSMQSIEQQESMTGAGTPGQQRYYDTLAANKAMNEQAYSATTARLNNIQALMQQSNMTQDPAQKADLQNRMAAEEAMVTNDQTRLQLTAQLQKAELQLAEQQRDREFKNAFLGNQWRIRHSLDHHHSACRDRRLPRLSRMGQASTQFAGRSRRTGANWRSRLSSWVRLQKSLPRRKAGAHHAEKRRGRECERSRSNASTAAHSHVLRHPCRRSSFSTA